jgi:hypothetical protein
LHVIAVGFSELRVAERLGSGDFEDNVQMACASAAQLDAIVTRDPSGFAGSPIPIWTPQELVQRLKPQMEQRPSAARKRRKRANRKKQS